jgi:uncharacterized protein
MYQLIIVMLLVWVGFVLFKKMRQPKIGDQPNNTIGQKMVACSTCDTHIPESEAIVKDGKIYCSKDCL